MPYLLDLVERCGRLYIQSQFIITTYNPHGCHRLGVHFTLGSLCTAGWLLTLLSSQNKTGLLDGQQEGFKGLLFVSNCRGMYRLS